MPAIHFDPYFDREDVSESFTMCGVVYSYEDADATLNWSSVTCKRCLRQRKRITEIVNNTESTIIKQMGDMADFFEKQEAQK